MLRQHYCGLYRNILNDFRAGTMRAWLDLGVKVRYRVVWNTWGRIEDHGLELDPRFDGPWKTWRGEDLQALEYQSRQERGFLGWVWYCSYVEVSYHIPDEKLALLMARDKQFAREEDELARQEFERAHQEAIAEQQRKIDALLKVKPWLGEPEAYQEGIDFLRVNDPEKGEVIVNMR